MKQRILSRILVFALILALLPTGVFADFAVYSDTETHWAKAAIEKWSGLEIIQGADGCFRPDDSITRGETAVILDRVMKYAAKSQNGFTDLGQAFYTDAMLRANAAGIMQGDAGTIRPTAKITREEAVVVLGRALGLSESTSGAAFTDGAAISTWAKGYVNAMAARGYIQGAGGLFNPKSAITRAEFVTILNNAIAKICHEATTYTESIVGTVIVNVPGTVLKNMTVTGDLILSEGVGEGDVTLENVTVTGRTTIRGGGANSIHIKGDSKISEIIIEKRDDGSIRIVTADGAEVDAVYVDDGSDDIILTGDFKSVTIAEGVDVKAVDASIKSVNMTGAATFDVDAKSTVDTLTAAGTAGGASVTVEGKVGTLTADAKITVDNDGNIAKAIVNANGVVVGGNKPSTVTVGSSVTDEPVDEEGDPLVTTPTGGGGGGGGGGSTPSLSVSVTKLTTVAADANHDDSAVNQAAVRVEQWDDEVCVVGNLENLKAFASTTPGQGTHKWVGLVVDTGLSSIVGVSYNGTALTSADVAEAASVGVPAGKFVLWVKADELVSADKTFTLAKSGYKTKTITVSFDNTVSLTGTVSKLTAVAQDANYEDSTANQAAVKVSRSGNAVTVTGNVDSLKAFASTTPGQGTHKWVGLVVDTGLSSIIGVSYNGEALTSADVDEAASVGVGAGKFVLWVKADELVSTSKTFTLAKTGYTTKTITVSFVDTVGVTKLTTVADDANYDDSTANQDAVSVSKSGNAVTVTGKLDIMKAFTSTTPDQGTHKWVGLVVDTGLSSIVGVSYNGEALTSADVAEAASVGVPAGKFVLWVKADELVSAPKTFTLEKTGYRTKTITISFVDTSPRALASAVVVSGVKNTAITAKSITITLEHASFRLEVAEIGSSINNWFTNLPAGLTTMVTLISNNRLGVKISGTPTEVSSAAMEITIPGEKLSTGVALHVTVDPLTTYYSITDAPAGPQVASVSNIHYELVNGDAYLAFTKPLNETGIQAYAVRFSKDGGETWEDNSYWINVDSDSSVRMGRLACDIETTTTYNKVLVLSIPDTGYTVGGATLTENFTYTVSGSAVGFTVVKNDDNDYMLTLSTPATEDELYRIEMSKADDAPDYYPMGLFYYYDSAFDPDAVSIPLKGDTGYEIVDGSEFEVRKITNETTSGMTISPKADLTGTVTKLETVNQTDGNTALSAANQAAVTVTQDGDAVTVTADTGALKSFPSTAGQGTHLWVGLVVDTGMSSILGVSYNDAPLTEADVAEAASVGVGAGKFVLWVKADELVTTAKTFKLSKTGLADKTVTVSMYDTTPLTGTVTKIASIALPAAQTNQDAVTVAKDGDTYTVSGKLADMVAYDSPAANQGTHKWVGLKVATGQASILGVKYNGVALTADDVAEAANFGATAGSFILWITP